MATGGNMQNEIWKPVMGYEKRYAVSSYGRVKSLIHGERILKPQKNTTGNMQISLSDGKHPKTFMIALLVARHFLPNPMHYKCISYKDGNPKNCRTDNLEWRRLTDRMERQYARFEKPVNQYDEKGRYLKTWKSAKEIAEHLHICPNSINSACRSDFLKYGYFWRYTKDYPECTDIPFQPRILKKDLKINQYTKDGIFIMQFQNIQEVMQILGKGKYQENIMKCCRGISATAYGFIWKYAE